MSAGWFVGLTPQPGAAAVALAGAVGLVGTRIAHAGGVFTVLDDSAVDGDGRWASVVAADAGDTVGLLFLGFGSDGQVAEARVGDGGWAAASVMM